MAVFSARVADGLVESNALTVRTACAAGLTLGLLVLAGWALDIGLLKSGLPGRSATQPLTAVCFCLCALSLGLSTSAGNLSRMLMRVFAAIPLLVVVLTLWQNALDTDWGLDTLLFPNAAVHEQTAQFLRPGRTAGATLLAIAILSSCVLSTNERTRAGRRLYVALTTVGALFSATVLLAFAYGLGALHSQVGLISAIILGLLFTGALFRRSDLGWMAVLSGDTVGGRSGRHLLLWLAAIVAILASIVRLGSTDALYGAPFETMVFSLAAIGLLFASVVLYAQRVNSLEGERCSALDKLRTAEEELAHSARSKDAFLSVVSHELRNPLASLRNGIEIVRRRAGADLTLTQAAAAMGRQMNQIVRLVEDLLDVSHASNGTLVLNRARVTLREIINGAIEVCRESISARGHVLIVNPAEVELAVDGDLHRLIRVVSNVLANSVQYTEPGGRISITTAAEGQQACITIVDTGIGIPPEALEHVFDTFAQVRARHARSDGGFGVGLALVRSLVQLHGGSVTAHSSGAGAGAGSTFVIQLPVVKASGATAQRALCSQSAQSRRMRIVVADDNTDAAESLASLLRLEGHEVRTAVDGVQAVEAAEQLRPDVVFLDMGMPRADGLEAARRIREQHWGRDIRLVALTGWGQEVERHRTQAAGLDVHLLKPVDPLKLGAILRSVNESGS